MGMFEGFESSGAALRVELVDPIVGPIKDKAGNASYIELHALDSKLGRDYDQAERSNVDPAHAALTPFFKNCKKLAAVTTGWYLVNPNTGEALDIPCTRENAFKFYTLDATDWWAQAWAKAANNVNFLTRPKPPLSSDTPNGRSATEGS
ncbi:hypothetical protein QMZ05_12515 [Bradyrhizobium sp. INPA03-11B]|uniref:hypothetical protein n=1 Tax=Bradyrhizobium sp. INPA03-11B TaxID=418598 RepID=UPI00338E81CE